MNQGDIYMADLNPIRGREQAGVRPVLILQSSFLNQKLTTIVIIPLTSNLAYDGFLTTYLISKKKSGLPRDSVALLHQIRTIETIRLIKRMGVLNRTEIEQLKTKLSNIFYTA